MATSTVRGQISIFAMDQGDTITAKLIPTRPLVQYFNGSVASPNWVTETSERPVIYPYVLSTLSTGIITAISNAEWWFNDVKITFPHSDFEETTYTVGSVAIPALRIKGNIMAPVTSDKSIRGSFDVLTGGNTTRITLTTDVRRQITTSTGYDGVLDADRGGVIDNTNPSLQVRAILRQGGQVVPVFTVDWYKFVANDTDDGTQDGETPLGKTGNPITLYKADIEIMETVFARFKVGSTVVATALFVIQDLSDPFVIKFSPTPKVTPTTPATTTVKVVAQNDKTETAIGTFTQFAFSLRNGTAEVRAKARGTNTFTTNFSDFAGSKELYLYVESKDDWV